MAVLLDTADDNATATLHALTRRLNVKVTRATVREQLLSHPDYPSLLSLSEVLTDWQVDNVAVRLNTIEQLRELPLPFVAHLHQHKGRYVLVTDQKEDALTYLDYTDGQTSQSKTLADFGQEWSGVVLLAEAGEESGEANYSANRRQEKLEALREPLLVFVSSLIFGLLIINTAADFTLLKGILLTTKIIGLIFCSLLVAKQIGYKSTLTDRLCRDDGKNNCDRVLNSAVAKLWGWLSWSDIGLVYFAGGMLTILLAGAANIWPLIYILALLTLPYAVFSVYYQARVVQQWCPLCLGVQGILLSEGTIALVQIRSLPITETPYLIFLVTFLTPTLAWVFLKPLLSGIGQSRREHDELLRLKRDPLLFQAMLSRQPKMPILPADLHPIVLGNPNAKHTITVVTNPYCPPCASVHSELEKLLKRELNLKINIIFYTCDGLSGKRGMVATHLMALPDEAQIQALNDWYSSDQKDYADWRNRYPVVNNKLYCAKLVQRHCDWCNQAEITGTPTLFINGYQQPKHYSLLQLVRFTDYLSAE